MQPTPRESAAAQHLVEAVLEMFHAFEEGAASRRAVQPRSDVPSVAHPHVSRRRDEPAQSDDRLLLPVPEVARRLSISDRTVWALISKGEITPVRLGRTVRVPIKNLEALIERHQSRSRKDSRR